ncbi:GGDEF domain-containing protein [Sphingobium sp. BYY-5]|uniref:GGDEF domain-containing protein n=1 Tax=Sphingobium sp. BYY-5 TaxID=2926400 RepID=UPI001FA7F105|nr:GGDEF domain-containing protein [Sphingobium sp. BYY-5]MCI4589418.1 GGDEF domain-containing protein [Sphingobium sp. BYY-5]
MSVSIVVLSLLFGSSVVMAIAMAVAWLHFGRQKHVLTWTASYAVAVFQWLANAGGYFLQSGPLFTLAGVGLVTSATLLAIGIRQRSGRTVSVRLFAIPALIAIGATAIAISPMGSQAMQGMITPTYVGVLMGISAILLWPKGRRFTTPELAFFSLLIAFAVAQMALAGSAILIRGPEEGKELYRAILSLFMPSIYVGTGVAAVLVVAGDLAQQLRRQMRHDPLTQVLNRRGLDEAAERAIAQARRHQRPLALVVCDLDGFKALNDSHGHIAGDQALQGFAQLLTLAVRRGDVVGRMGGDEFGLLLQDSSAGAAADVMERVRAEVSHLLLPRIPNTRLRASFGVAELIGTDMRLEDMVARADDALYTAKKDGKNRVSIARPAA